MPPKRYKTRELYMCLALNRLISELDIDLHQDNLEDMLEEILETRKCAVSKAEISYEIKSNHTMTNAVLDRLTDMGLVEVSQLGRSYDVGITKKGILYARRFNEFYIATYQDLIKQHYRYTRLPSWFSME